MTKGLNKATDFVISGGSAGTFRFDVLGLGLGLGSVHVKSVRVKVRVSSG